MHSFWIFGGFLDLDCRYAADTLRAYISHAELKAHATREQFKTKDRETVVLSPKQHELIHTLQGCGEVEESDVIKTVYEEYFCVKSWPILRRNLRKLQLDTNASLRRQFISSHTIRPKPRVLELVEH